MRVAIATCQKPPHPDVDHPVLLAALAERGIVAESLAWNDPAARFEDHDVVVVRSTWDYFHDVEAFLAWTARVGRAARLLNPADVLAWNARKSYLLELEAQGVAIVPTAIVAKGERRSLADLATERGWSEVVVKPLVSAGSFRTERFCLHDEPGRTAAQAFLDALSAQRDVMVQPWMPVVETYGERSLVWVGGALSHAIRKAPRFETTAPEFSGALPIADDERAFAERVIAPYESRLLYGRVDTIRDEDGSIRLMELELIEPFLFLGAHPPAAARLAEAIARLG
ncbi:MAG: hypothetical protein JWP97_3981 [Labilithrix sp.]|nr:hypothetical protein [Labilithrix sp.]